MLLERVLSMGLYTKQPHFAYCLASDGYRMNNIANLTKIVNFSFHDDLYSTGTNTR
jgi:hypothetical protein